ncbi:hypothetical protein KCP77_08040 [Salmonella enterica subsp. enterica]|nr:hypothetical protein KCP77_08040 [Salmonella enterica subsp. enterica]
MTTDYAAFSYCAIATGAAAASHAKSIVYGSSGDDSDITATWNCWNPKAPVNTVRNAGDEWISTAAP